MKKLELGCVSFSLFILIACAKQEPQTAASGYQRSTADVDLEQTEADIKDILVRVRARSDAIAAVNAMPSAPSVEEPSSSSVQVEIRVEESDKLDGGLPPTSHVESAEGGTGADWVYEDSGPTRPPASPPEGLTLPGPLP